MIPFFDELARVTAPARAIAIAYTRGRGNADLRAVRRASTPSSSRRGFSQIAHFSAGDGISLLARRPGSRRSHGTSRP